MYRYFTGKDRKAYYRCAGRSPQRHGCGNMVPLAALEAEVTEMMEADMMNKHMERKFIPGDSLSEQIGKLRESGAEAMKIGDYAAATDYMRQAEELETAPRVAPHWEKVESGLYEGEYFTGLDMSERRAYLAQRSIITAHRWDDGTINVGLFPRDWYR